MNKEFYLNDMIVLDEENNQCYKFDAKVIAESKKKIDSILGIIFPQLEAERARMLVSWVFEDLACDATWRYHDEVEEDSKDKVEEFLESDIDHFSYKVDEGFKPSKG